VASFGQNQSGVTSIEGLDLLQAYKADKVAQGEEPADEESQWQEWAEASDDEEDNTEEGWVNVASDDEVDIVLTDSEDEDEPSPKKTKQVVPEPDEPITFEFNDDSDEDSDASEEEGEDADVPELVVDPEITEKIAALSNLASTQVSLSSAPLLAVPTAIGRF
jgi:hypothetical protein